MKIVFVHIFARNLLTSIKPRPGCPNSIHAARFVSHNAPAKCVLFDINRATTVDCADVLFQIKRKRHIDTVLKQSWKATYRVAVLRDTTDVLL